MGSVTKASPTARSPSFFKVMIGDFSTDLRIPPAFTKHFDGVVPHKSIIMRSPGSKVWCVHVQKVDQCLFFQKGWREFVQDNFLELGDFLVFHYVGNSKFEVIIYGKHCCEKELLASTAKGDELQEKAKRENRQRGERGASPPLPPDKERQRNVFHKGRGRSESFDRFNSSRKGSMDERGSKEPDEYKSGADQIQAKRSEVIQIESDSSSFDEMDNDSNSSSGGDDLETKEDRLHQGNERKYEPSKLKQPVEEKIADGGGGMPTTKRCKQYSEVLPPSAAHEEDEALRRAKAFKSENPFFVVTMQPTYVTTRYNLNIPMTFFKRHFTKDTNIAALSVPEGGTWPVKCSVGKRDVKFSRGWKKFVVDNRLKEGDVCALEMIKSTGTSLKVVIFRKDEGANGRMLQRE